MYNILWDFDGTIAYREGMWSGTLLSLMKKNGITDIPIEPIKEYLQTGFTWHKYEYSHIELFNGRTWHQYYEDYFYGLFTKAGIKENISRNLSKNVIHEYTDKSKWFIYDDVIKALDKSLEKGCTNYILSNHVPELRIIVENLGLTKYFRKIYNSAEIGYEKPNVKFYEYMLKDSKADRGKCIIIGDSYEVDIKGGEKIGIQSILVRKENKNNHRWYCSDLENIIERIYE